MYRTCTGNPDFRVTPNQTDIFPCDHNVHQKQTNHNSLYTIADNEIQSSSDSENQNEAVDWKSTNSHKGELFIAYDNKVKNKTEH